MTLSQIYLTKAKEVAKSNQYTCNMFEYYQGEAFAREVYQDMLGPYWIKHLPLGHRYWWSADCACTNEIGTYAHNARVIALLLAHEMAKTGDMGT